MRKQAARFAGLVRASQNDFLSCYMCCFLFCFDQGVGKDVREDAGGGTLHQGRQEVHLHVGEGQGKNPRLSWKRTHPVDRSPPFGLCVNMVHTTLSSTLMYRYMFLHVYLRFFLSIAITLSIPLFCICGLLAFCGAWGWAVAGAGTRQDASVRRRRGCPLRLRGRERGKHPRRSGGGGSNWVCI